MYVLRKNGHFVAREGSEQRYTLYLQYARLFPSIKTAAWQAHPGETPLSLVEAVQSSD